MGGGGGDGGWAAAWAAVAVACMHACTARPPRLLKVVATVMATVMATATKTRRWRWPRHAPATPPASWQPEAMAGRLSCAPPVWRHRRRRHRSTCHGAYPTRHGSSRSKSLHYAPRSRSRRCRKTPACARRIPSHRSHPRSSRSCRTWRDHFSTGNNVAPEGGTEGTEVMRMRSAAGGQGCWRGASLTIDTVPGWLTPSCGATEQRPTPTSWMQHRGVSFGQPPRNATRRRRRRQCNT